jgi:asparagine synthase (glutamine-hydrolysing)
VYSEFAGDFFIASKARAIMSLTQHRKWDRDALIRSIHHQYAPPNRTLFDGIRSLPPGYVLKMEKGELSTKRYWDFYNIDDRDSQSLEAALTKAVEKRLQGEGPVTCSLSGGIDSSAIAALLSKIQPHTQAFSVDFAEEGHANVERQEAERVAKHLNIELNVVEVNPVDVFENLGASVLHSEGLAINAHLSAKYLLSKKIQEKNFKVVLSGEGADEIFYGYPHLRQDIFGCDAKSIRGFDKVSGGVMVAGMGVETDSEIEAKLGFVPSFFRAKLSLGGRVISQTKKSMQDELALLGPLSMLDGFALIDVPTSKAKGSAYLWTKLALEKYILSTLGDGTEMAHGIEGRTPFLDAAVIQTAFGFTPSSCFKAGMEKIQLREAMAKLLPKETLARHKQPFIGPPVSFSKSAEEMVHERLKKLEGSEIWDADALRKTWLEKSTASRIEQQKWDPVFMLAFSFDEIQKQHRLEAL